MDLKEIIEVVSGFAESASELFELGEKRKAYNELDSLHDFLLDEFMSLPEPK